MSRGSDSSNNLIIKMNRTHVFSRPLWNDSVKLKLENGNTFACLGNGFVRLVIGRRLSKKWKKFHLHPGVRTPPRITRSLGISVLASFIFVAQFCLPVTLVFLLFHLENFPISSKPLFYLGPPPLFRFFCPENILLFSSSRLPSKCLHLLPVSAAHILAASCPSVLRREVLLSPRNLN